MGTERKEELDNIIYAANNPKMEVQQQQYDPIAELEREIAELKVEVEYQKNLNKNLLRINKERANADRNLRPKKEHTGYVVISSYEKDVRYKAGKTTKTARVWETVLQSPYSIDFSEEQAKKQIYRELLTNEGGWKLGAIGIKYRQILNFNDLINVRGNEIFAENTAYSYRLKANFRSRYWEFIVQHTLPLDTVPKEMLP